MSVEDVLKSANGLTLYGSDAVKAGLADSVTSLQEVMGMTTESKDMAVVGTVSQLQLDTEKARADTAEKELNAFKEEAKKVALASAAVECKAAVKAGMGRDATEAEVTAYQGMSTEARSVYTGMLTEAKSNRDKLIEKSGLTKEQVSGEENPHKAALAENGLVQAAVRLGFTDSK